jgi:membrane associated rhomboid family serine protease
VSTIVFLLIFIVLAYRATTPETRSRAVQAIVDRVRRTQERRRKQLEPLERALHERTPHPVATYALIAVNVLVFLGMVFGKGSLDESSTLISWGAGFGPRTTNGEWWRLVTAPFVNPSLFALAINMVALLHVGRLLERFVGWLMFITVFAAAAILSGLVSLATEPVRVTSGASGAVWGLYGLFATTMIASALQESIVKLPLIAMKQAAPVAAIFAWYNLAAGNLGSTAEACGAIVGALLGVAVARNVVEAIPQRRHIGWAAGTALVVALVSAFWLRGIADVRPELDRLVKIEEHTSEAYQAATRQFKSGAITAVALAQLIDRTILPELKAADTRINAIAGIPREHQERMNDAREYLRLRSESWHLRALSLRESGAPAPDTAAKPTDSATFRARAEARHRSTNATLGKAEATERAALETLQRIRIS